MNQFTDRRYVFAVIITLVGLVYIARLFHIQVLDKSYEQFALSNAQSVRIIYPARGLIYDRNGEILVYNQAAYDLMITPRQLEPFDTTEICRILNITREDVKERIRSAKSYSYRVPSVFMKQVSYEHAALLQEKLFQYPGFYVQTRTLRKYTRNTAKKACRAAEGARIFTTLLHAMKKQNAKYGLATLCIGGGEASAVIVERI